MNDTLNLDKQLCFALYSASRASTAVYRPMLDELGVTYPQYLVLLVLWEKDGISVSELGVRLDLDSGTLSPLLKRIEALSLITRERSADDERRVEIHVTDAGRALRIDAASIPECIFAAAGLTEKEATTLIALVRKTTASLKRNNVRGTP